MSRRTFLPLLAAALLGPAGVAAAAPVDLGVGRRPWVSVDRQGVTHVVFEQDAGSQSTLVYLRRAPGAAAFEAPRTFAVAPGQDFSGPVVLQDPAPGTRLVLVAERCCTTPSTWAMTSADNGVTWSAPQPVFDGAPAVNQVDGRVPIWALTAGSLDLVVGNPGFSLAQVPAALAPPLPASGVTPMGGAPYDTQVTLDEAGQPVFAWGADFSAAFLRRGVAGPDVPVLTGGTGVSVHIAGGARGVGVLTLRREGTAGRLEFRRLAGGAPDGRRPHAEAPGRQQRGRRRDRRQQAQPDTGDIVCAEQRDGEAGHHRREQAEGQVCEPRIAARRDREGQPGQKPEEEPRGDE